MENSHNIRKNNQPLEKFIKFFKSYGIGISLVISAFPLTTPLWHLFPMFEGVKPLLTIIATVGSILLVCFIFMQRHAIGRLFFPGLQAGSLRVAHASELRLARLFKWLPAALLIFAVISLISYFTVVHKAEQSVIVEYLHALSVFNEGYPPIDKCENVYPNYPIWPAPGFTYR